jgi:hypothetical protein
MTYDTWADLRNYLIDQFNEAPHPATEQDIIDAFENHPDQVIDAAQQVAHDVKAGTARSGWGVLRARANRIRTPIANPTRDASVDREKRVMRAEQWLRAAGLLFDTEREILDELFGSTGILRAYAQIEQIQVGTNERGHPIWGLSEPKGDLALVQRMLDTWRMVRPAGQDLERAARERAAMWKQKNPKTQGRNADNPPQADNPTITAATGPEPHPEEVLPI